MGRISRGFTLVEMIVVAPVIILSIGAFIAAIVHMTGEVMSSRGSNTAAYEVQDTLNRIEQDIKLSIAFLPETSVDFSSSNPQGLGENGRGKFENVSSSGTNALILAAPATNGNPLSEDVGYIYMENTPNSCASGQYANNVPLITNVVYFVDDNDVLWRRTVMPVSPSNLCGGVPWQQASCSPGRNHAFCATEDIKLLEGVSGSGFSLEYFTDSTSGSSNADASNPSLDAEGRRGALETSQAIDVSVSSNKSIAGRDISHTGSLRVSRIDTNRTSISGLGFTYGSSPINIDSGYIGTTDLTGQSPELNGYVSDYTDVVFDWGQLDGADKYYPQYRISTDGGSTWGSWSNALHNYTNVFPPHVRSYKVTNAHHGDKIEFRVRGSNLNGQSSYATKQITIPVWVPLQLQNAWVDYNPSYSPASFTMTRSGMVMVRGMIKGGTVAHGTVIGNLPAKYRPSGTLLFTTTTASNVYARLDVTSAGNIVFSGNNFSNTWTSLDTIRFIPDSVTSYTRTTATLSGGFTHYGGSFENVRYLQDSVGRVHLQGLARSGSTVASGNLVASIPAALRPSQFQLHSGNSTAYQHLGINTTAGVETRANGTVNNHSSMNMRWLPASHTGWKNLCNGNTCENSWIFYGPSFTTPQYSKTADNVVNLKGLLKSGITTAGTQMAVLPANCRPDYRIMYSTASANAHTRIEIDIYGRILFTGGSNSWMSLDNITFIASKNGPC